MIFQKKIFEVDECLKIINLNKINTQLWYNDDRNYESQSIKYNEETNWIFERLQNFFEETTKQKITNVKKEIHFHTFKVGDWFGRHSDAKSFRIFSIGVLLNNDFEGGEFILYDKENVVLEKTIGNCYIFNVDIEHEITKVVEGNRFSIIWFIDYNQIKLKSNSII